MIVLLEPSDLMRQMIAELVERGGHQVIPTRAADEALSALILHGGSVNVVIAAVHIHDFAAPGSINQFCAEVRSAGDICIIGVTMNTVAKAEYYDLDKIYFKDELGEDFLWVLAEADS